MDPRVNEVVEQLSAGAGRVCFLLDDADRLVWVSDELRAFIGARVDTDLGIGRHISEMGRQPVWRNALSEESQGRLAMEVMAAPRAGAASAAQVRTGVVDYLQPGLPPYPIDFVATSLRDERGALLATMVLMYLQLRPSIVALLGRGDATMYERMARLIHPERRATAILFADLQASGELSRTLSTGTYFELISDLTAGFDTLVAEHRGIVGKHAGDGWTAFVLAQDVGGPSAAVAGCLEIAQRLRDRAADPAHAPKLPPGMSLRVNAGIHWGPGVYLGQLVPGGRLEVTALGDEVNECARIQQCARDGALFASKQAIELLEPADARRLDVDPVALTYVPLAAMDSATDKTRRDAGTVAVAPIA